MMEGAWYVSHLSCDGDDVDGLGCEDFVWRRSSEAELEITTIQAERDGMPL